MTISLYAYTSRDGNVYKYRLSNAIAEITGLGWGSPIEPGSANPFWGTHRQSRRHRTRYVTALSATGQRRVFPCATNTATLFVNGGTFTYKSVLWAVKTAIEEQEVLG